MNSFFLKIPTRIYFGRDKAIESLKKEKSLIGDKAMIITTSKSLVRQGYVEEIESCVDSIIYTDISPEPQLSDVREAVKIGKSEKVTSVIGFGGGSSIDAAKATALGIGSEESIDRFYYDGLIPNKKAIHVIAIPTTAGTGSELSGSAVISDSSTNMKKGIRGWFMYPDVAIVDPKYTDMMPYEITKVSGFDALAHAIETYVSVKATRLSDVLSEEAIKIIAEMLPRLKDSQSDAEARDAMSYASMLMGINIGNVGTLLPHRLQYPVGMKTHKSHGEGLLSLFPAWYEEEYKCRSNKIRRVSELLTGAACDDEEQIVKAIGVFIDRIGGRKSLRELGITDEDISEFSKSITGVLQNDPAYNSIDVINRIYQNSMN